MLTERPLFILCVLFLLEIAKQVGPTLHNNTEGEKNALSSASGDVDDDTSAEIPTKVRKDYIIMLEEDETASRRSESNPLLALLRGLEERRQEKLPDLRYAHYDYNGIEPFYTNNDESDDNNDSDYDLGSKARLIGENLYKNFLEEDDDRRDDVGQTRFVEEPVDSYGDQAGGNYAPAVYDYDDDNDRDRYQLGDTRDTLPFSPDLEGAADDGRTIILEEDDDDRKRRAEVRK